MAFVDFAKLKSGHETHRDIKVKAWDENSVRILHLPALELMHLLEMRDAFEQGEDGKLVHDEDSLEFAIGLVSACVADESGVKQFDSDEGRSFLRTEISALFELLTTAIEVHKLDEDKAKKNKG